SLFSISFFILIDSFAFSAKIGKVSINSFTCVRPKYFRVIVGARFAVHKNSGYGILDSGYFSV
ncbi:MAG TPA: hypothetical protein PLX23_03680, partial [Candidatus Hydrogenedens sp.]|nr:hypothetical protein [Candidatus Hydrogenedens sp.]